jgi:thymidylate synthase
MEMGNSANKLDHQYKVLLQTIMHHGNIKGDRTGVGTRSIFGYMIRHDMADGFPAITTKKLAFKTMVTELMWFLQGRTDLRYLLQNNCHIWTGDAYKKYEKWVEALQEKYTNPTTENAQKVAEVVAIPKIVKLTVEEFERDILANDDFNSMFGDLGPIYGKQWRSWEGVDKDFFFNSDALDEENRDARQGLFYKPESFDQIANLINDLRTNPDSRRLLLNAWNVADVDKAVLPPCHIGFQLYTRKLTETELVERLGTDEEKQQLRGILLIKNAFVKALRYEEAAKVRGEEKEFYAKFEKKLSKTRVVPERAISLMWSQRSVDTLLGLPFNIASYGLLLEIIAKEVNMIPDELIGMLGDTHLYNNHITAAAEQITRFGHPLPKLKINQFDKNNHYIDERDDISEYDPSQFSLIGYESDEKIEAKLNN